MTYCLAPTPVDFMFDEDHGYPISPPRTKKKQLLCQHGGTGTNPKYFH